MLTMQHSPPHSFVKLVIPANPSRCDAEGRYNSLYLNPIITIYPSRDIIGDLSDAPQKGEIAPRGVRMQKMLRESVTDTPMVGSMKNKGGFRHGHA